MVELRFTPAGFLVMVLSKEKRQKFYATRQWRRKRALHLEKFPFCQYCFEGIGQKMRRFIAMATVVDHIDPTWDSFHSFITAKVQSLCKKCHDLKTKSIDSGIKNRKELLKIEVSNI